MTICFVFDCNHQGLRKTCKMFRFPASSALAKKWEILCRGKDRSMIPQNDRICSCHFVDGEKSNGPTLFPLNSGKMFNFPDPSKLKRTEKREIKEKAVSEDQCESTAMSCQPSHVSLDHSYQASYHQLKEENQNLRREVEELRIQVRMMSTKRAFRIGDILNDERKVRFGK
ncbi:uncharacterized protein LOC134270478 [Saccostrea cucullata]|uniref:uncharacterized protein LOC134270478 n=1 Tax=Saccostrea cuccullata TaxID=36930 RepID=UPI002ED0CCE0